VRWHSADGLRQVLVFSTMTRLLDILGGHLDWHGIAYLRLDGGTPSDERGDLVRCNQPLLHEGATSDPTGSRPCLHAGPHCAGGCLW
jgi:hypothetical protein